MNDIARPPAAPSLMSGLLHERVSPTTFGVVRAAVFVIWLVVVVPDRLSFLGTLPPSMFHPIGIFRLVPRELWPRLLAPKSLVAFEALLVVLLVLSASGMRPYRPIAILTALLLTVHQALVREFTFENHEELALLVVTYVLALFPAADGFSWPPRRASVAGSNVYSAGLLAMSVFLVVPYCGIAAHRLAYAAPEIFTGESFPSWLASLDSLDPDGWGLGRAALGHPTLITLFKATFAVTTIFELLAPLTLILPRFRRVWVVVMVSFHVMSWFTLNLFFWENALLVLLLLTDLESHVAKFRAAVRRA